MSQLSQDFKRFHKNTFYSYEIYATILDIKLFSVVTGKSFAQTWTFILTEIGDHSYSDHTTTADYGTGDVGDDDDERADKTGN